MAVNQLVIWSFNIHFSLIIVVFIGIVPIIKKIRNCKNVWNKLERSDVSDEAVHAIYNVVPLDMKGGICHPFLSKGTIYQAVWPAVISERFRYPVHCVCPVKNSLPSGNRCEERLSFEPVGYDREAENSRTSRIDIKGCRFSYLHLPKKWKKYKSYVPLYWLVANQAYNQVKLSFGTSRSRSRSAPMSSCKRNTEY